MINNQQFIILFVAGEKNVSSQDYQILNQEFKKKKKTCNILGTRIVSSLFADGMAEHKRGMKISGGNEMARFGYCVPPMFM